MAEDDEEWEVRSDDDRAEVAPPRPDRRGEAELGEAKGSKDEGE